ncbi:MAG: hypothetical protein IIV78_02645, partial [Oscillospiraceae bacterium]|nr:hypothetical protein [Oscillospiraceae bacterium]
GRGLDKKRKHPKWVLYPYCFAHSQTGIPCASTRNAFTVYEEVAVKGVIETLTSPASAATALRP